jgi:uncharacterized glyoxalase superfamily protein PhnB
MKTTLDMIGIVCADIDASLAFYRTIGIDAPESSGGEDHVEAKLANGLRLAWDSLALIKQMDPGWVQPVGQRMGVAFLCDSPAEVVAIFTKATLAGYKAHKEPWDAFWGQRYAQLTDPDGNVVDLFAWL